MQAPHDAGSSPDAGLLDCVVIGAGAAGLTAAIYLARFHRRIAVIDGRASRLLSIPTSHNYPGFIGGIHGEELLARLRAQVAEYNVDIYNGTIEQLERLDDGSFIAHCGAQQWHARTVILATGVVDVEPDFPDVKQAVAKGCVRYCPICDGFESSGKRVAVIGRGKGGLGEALFVGHFTPHISLFSLADPPHLDDAEQQKVRASSLRVVTDPVERLSFDDAGVMQVQLRSGAQEHFDVIYVALGTMVNSGMALLLGAKSIGNGELLVDAHQQTSVDGLYAAGDIVAGLNQITVAMGQAAVAAAAIHNRLNAWHD